MNGFPWIKDLQRRLAPAFLVIGALALAAGSTAAGAEPVDGEQPPAVRVFGDGAAGAGILDRGDEQRP